ncbi:MAG: hypothetical protein H6Q51_2166 [Deltaproteobacteria bacterium]|nr:hypothetical protein [Deltaproteobacteria bacterium]
MAVVELHPGPEMKKDNGIVLHSRKKSPGILLRSSRKLRRLHLDEPLPLKSGEILRAEDLPQVGEEILVHILQGELDPRRRRQVEGDLHLCALCPFFREPFLTRAGR